MEVFNIIEIGNHIYRVMSITGSQLVKITNSREILPTIDNMVKIARRSSKCKCEDKARSYSGKPNLDNLRVRGERILPRNNTKNKGADPEYKKNPIFWSARIPGTSATTPTWASGC